MKVSVIIPTLNCEKTIENLLKRLKNQTQKADEVIVVDSESNDNTAEIAEEEGAKVIKIKRRDFDHGGTRNFAVENSTGDAIIFLTQDALPYDEYFIENIVGPLKNSDVAAVYGRQIANEDAIPTEKFARLFNYPEKGFIKSKENIKELRIKAFFFSNVCSAIRRKEFEQAGKFPDNTIMNEDMIIASKLILNGYKIAYSPNAIVIHYHNYSPIKQFKRNFDIGVFFSENSWILKYGKAEGEGIKFLKDEIEFLWNNDKKWIIYAIIDNIFRYSGYQCGLKHKFIPLFIKKRISMNTNYWLIKERRF
ncbi:glycosyltransferase family 2 protein [Thermoanaerobacterium sp. RBIITD]|uniref:glycosyltransferase family 2 protein n=1 Tax=Thermoanaerobacterium sp. RBIITD TaxID=1550240 RepID=UPI000BB6C259|nr:glycosyltransferase family 2 protein [Thermoanaerobacterium sp. RBIITD]SNX52857.1 rhamnosyltransferase [Thermoanaerobacterium sp. RBIITD]